MTKVMKSFCSGYRLLRSWQFNGLGKHSRDSNKRKVLKKYTGHKQKLLSVIVELIKLNRKKVSFL